MKYLISVCTLVLLLSCDNNDEIRELSFTNDYLNSYHLRGDMVFYESGLVVETINLDERQESGLGRFENGWDGSDGASGFISSFSNALDIYVGVSGGAPGNYVTSYKEYPNIFRNEIYSMIPNSSFGQIGNEFFGASYFYEGPDKNYNYYVGEESTFNMLAMYLGKESIFKGDNGNEDVAIFVGNFSAVLKPHLVDESDLDHIPDSIQLNVSSVKGFLHGGR